MSESDPSVILQSILDLLVSAGYANARNADLSVPDKLTGGLAWCIAASRAVGPQFELLSYKDFNLQDKMVCSKVQEFIETALRSMGCPYPLQAHQIQDLDCKGVYPVVQWVVNRVLSTRAETGDEATYIVHAIEEEEHTLQQLEKELSHAEDSIKILHTNVKEQEQKKANVVNEIQHLHERIDKEDANNMVQRLISLLELLKDLESQESDFRSCCKQRCSDLQAEVIELESKILSSNESKNLSDNFDHSFHESLEKLNSAKSELAAKLREIILLKRQLGDVPSQTELIQYERRFSELFVQIQEKLRQTRKYYATYNALLEIKELMLKETSLLNSISSQFQDAITITTGRMKLIDSMEGILKRTQQKLEKVQLGLHAEQKVCDILKEKYTAAIAEQRHCSSLLKAFQEECAKNERLQSQTSI